MDSADAGDDLSSGRSGSERKVFSSESRRSFEPASPEVAEQASKSKSKPQREQAADETKKVKDETSLQDEGSAKTPASSREPDIKKPEGDEPPASLDKSVDEGPL